MIVAADLAALWPVWTLVLLPLICGCIIVTYTLLDAQKNVRVWRREFQFAMDSQCPHIEADIIGGEGKVYLDAYRYDYQWVGDGVDCTGNGKTIQCSCRFSAP